MTFILRVFGEIRRRTWNIEKVLINKSTPPVKSARASNFQYICNRISSQPITALGTKDKWMNCRTRTENRMLLLERRWPFLLYPEKSIDTDLIISGLKVKSINGFVQLGSSVSPGLTQKVLARGAL